jgi:hypothetical protein
LLGETVSRSREATSLDVSGERSVAFVSLGFASRVTAALRGFLLELVVSAKALAAAGVGVTGGGAAGVAGLPCARFLGGVEGAWVSSWAALRVRVLLFDFALASGSTLVPSVVLIREELLVTAIACADIGLVLVLSACNGDVNDCTSRE